MGDWKGIWEVNSRVFSNSEKLGRGGKLRKSAAKSILGSREHILQISL